jgi:hypothetical protein
MHTFLQSTRAPVAVAHNIFAPHNLGAPLANMSTRFRRPRNVSLRPGGSVHYVRPAAMIHVSLSPYRPGTRKNTTPNRDPKISPESAVALSTSCSLHIHFTKYAVLQKALNGQERTFRIRKQTRKRREGSVNKTQPPLTTHARATSTQTPAKHLLSAIFGKVFGLTTPLKKNLSSSSRLIIFRLLLSLTAASGLKKQKTSRVCVSGQRLISRNTHPLKLL